MEPIKIDAEELEIKYFPRFLREEKIIAVGGATAVKYLNRRDHALSSQITYTAGVLVLFYVISGIIWASLRSENLLFNLSLLFAPAILGVLLVDQVYRGKYKTPDYPQYFFLTTHRLFINNKKGDFEVPYKNIRRVEPIIYDEKNKKLAIIKIYENNNFKRHKLYASTDEARAIHEHLIKICKRNESENSYGFYI